MTPQETRRISPHKLKPNPMNPRVIRDQSYKKLLQSIKDFPEMLELRPIVVDKDLVVLGGNMRLRACRDAGIAEVPYIIADKLTEEQQREFVIKDNVSGGEWDWEILANEWDSDPLNDWGLDVPEFNVEEEEVDLTDHSAQKDTYLNNAIRQIVLYYDKEAHTSVLERLSRVCEDYGFENDNSASVLKLLEFYEQNRDTTQRG